MIGSFAEDLRGFAGMTHGAHALAGHGRSLPGAEFLRPQCNQSVAHGQPVSGQLILYNSAYALIYATMAICGAVLMFERRNLK